MQAHEERWKQVYDRYLNNEKYKDIATSMKISPTRARELAFRYQGLLFQRGVKVATCASCGRTRLEHKSRAHEFVESLI